MKIVESSIDTRIHLANPGSTTTLCGLWRDRDLPHIPAEKFGVVETLENGEPDMPWCVRCSKRKPRAPSYDVTMQRYWKEQFK